MKKIIYLFLPFMALTACSTDAVESENFDSLDAKAVAKNDVSVQSKVSTVILPDCLDCVSERVLFEDNTSDQVGNSSNYKDVNYQIWNTSTQLIVQTINTYATDKVEIVVNGNTITNDPAVDVPAGQMMFTYFDLPEGYTSCEYTLTSVKVFGGPQAELTSIDYGVYVYCDSCEESFTYVDNGDKTYTFTYIPGEDMTGAELVFTFAQGTSVTGLSSDWTHNGHGNAQTHTRTMNLDECEVYVWTVGLDGTCSGNSQHSNVWTDFKVNTVSKKANPEDKFIQSCD